MIDQNRLFVYFMKHFLYKKIIFCPLFNNRARYQSLLKLARRTSYLALGEKLGCGGLIVISFANPISSGVPTNFATPCGKVGTRNHVLRENPLMEVSLYWSSSSTLFVCVGRVSNSAESFL
jgi:hypothetical protein